MSLSWQAPGSDGGAAITGYRVYQGTSKKPVASVTGTGTTVKNLTNGTAYSFKVTAVNKAGEGPASGAASATPTAKVTNRTAERADREPGNGKVTLSWTAPGSDGRRHQRLRDLPGNQPGRGIGTPVNATWSPALVSR